jgi:hypothetical protein
MKDGPDIPDALHERLLISPLLFATERKRQRDIYSGVTFPLLELPCLVSAISLHERQHTQSPSLLLFFFLFFTFMIFFYLFLFFFIFIIFIYLFLFFFIFIFFSSSSSSSSYSSPS